VWLPAPLYPSEFPDTAAAVRALVRTQDGTALDLLDQLIRPETKRVQMLLAAPLSEGVFVGGVIVSSPPRPRGYGAPRGSTPPGFRKGRIPKALQLSNFFGSQRIERIDVVRSEASWVHGRGRDTHLNVLQAAHVTVVGCGSVGASVGLLLAQAGIGNFIFVDPERLTSSNTSRHPLGAQNVEQKKCIALANKLRADFPHLQSVKGIPQGWEKLSTEELAEIRRCDLIVCAIGNIGIELAINHWAMHTRKDGAILYAWLEPFACAAHGVLLVNGGCFECGFDDRNQPKVIATEWPNRATTYREPGCAATFQPYGAVELMAGVSMVAELALDRLIGRVTKTIERIRGSSTDRLRQHGGNWSEAWTALTNGDESNRTLERPWEPATACRRCNPA